MKKNKISIETCNAFLGEVSSENSDLPMRLMSDWLESQPNFASLSVMIASILEKCNSKITAGFLLCSLYDKLWRSQNQSDSLNEEIGG